MVIDIKAIVAIRFKMQDIMSIFLNIDKITYKIPYPVLFDKANRL